MTKTFEPVLMKKGGSLKYANSHEILEILISAGWKREDNKELEGGGDNIEVLKAEATALGIEFHPRTGTAKLKEAIAAKKAE